MIDSITVYKTTEPGRYINSNCISFNNKIEIITPIPEFLKTNIEKATSHEDVAVAIATAVINFQANDNVNYIENPHMNKEAEAAATAIATAVAAARDETETERMNKEEEAAATAIATAAKAEEDRVRKEEAEAAATAIATAVVAFETEAERMNKEAAATAIATAAKAEEEDRVRKEEEAAAARAEAEAKAMAIAVAVNAINDDNIVLEYENFLSENGNRQGDHTDFNPNDDMANRLAMSLTRAINTYNNNALISPNKTGGHILHAGDVSYQDQLRTAFTVLYGNIQKNVDTFTSHPLIYKLNSLDNTNFESITNGTDNVDLYIRYCAGSGSKNCSTFKTDQVRNELSNIISILIPKTDNADNSPQSGSGTHIRDLLSTYTTSVDKAITYNTPYANATTFKNWTKINDKMKNVYTEFLKKIYDNAATGPTENKLENKVDEIIGNINKNKLLTYIKINNTNPKGLQTNMNKRFKLLVTDKKNKLVVKYNPDNIPYYDKELMKTGEITESVELTNMMKNNPEEPKKYDFSYEILNINTYDNEYLYGNFTNVFVPSESNAQIAQQMDVVINKLQKTEPVFIVGYGASGAGKTSSLIQYNKEPGIIIQLCNMMATNGSNGSIKYTSIEVKIEEYYVEISANAINNEYSDYNKACVELKCNEMGPINNDTTTHDMSFTYNNNNWTLNNNNNNITLGDKLMEHIDTNRKVGATTNNPNSSRSHVLVYVKFKNSSPSSPGPDPVLIIGDLAGVENKFACKNTDILTQFLTIKPDTKPGETVNIPFYRDSKTCNEIIKSSANKGGGAIGDDCDNLITPLFNFVNMKENVENKEIIISALEANTAEDDENKEIIKSVDDENIGRVLDVIRSFELGDNPYDKIMREIPETSTNTLDPNLIDFFRSLFLKPPISQKIQNRTALLAPLPKLRNSLRTLYASQTINYNKIISEITEFRILDNITIVNDVVFHEYNIIQKNTDSKMIANTIDSDMEYKIDKLIRKYPIIRDTLSDTIKYIKKTNLPVPITGCEKMTQSSFFNLQNGEQINIKNMFNEDGAIIEGIKNNNKINLNKDDDTHIITQAQLDNISGNTVYYKCKNTGKAPAYGQVNASPVPLYVAINNYYISHIQKIFDEKVKKPIIDYIQNLQKNKHALQDTPYLKGVYKADVKQNHINAAKTIIETTRNQLKYAEKICKIRRAEGYYINYTLQQMRDDIRKTVLAKGDGLSPDFVNDCIKDYCEGREYECFKPEIQNNSTDNMYEPTSLIFKNIKEYLYPGQAIDNKVFFEKILVGIFCVFNISNIANNPPPVPYVDINELKKAFYNSTSANIADLVKDLEERIHKINYPFNDNKTTGNVTVDFDSLNTLKTSITKSDQDTNTTDSKRDIKQMDHFNIENKLPGGLYGKIESVIKEIDNHNASTSIGTLDFTDNIAKYITVHNTCKYNNTIEEKLQLKEFDASKTKPHST